VSGAERNTSQREVVLEPREAAFGSLEELVEACLPTLTARLWATCGWAKRPGAGRWKVGDYNFLVAEVCPDPECSLYVQFWSEPQAAVIAEVSSGEWNPGALKYLRAVQKERLQALGYAVGHQSSNFRKEVRVRSSADAEALASETLGIFFEVFGYRGQWPLEVNRHRGERAEHAPVYSSLTPEDVARLAALVGIEVEIREDPHPVARLRRGKRTFLARFDGNRPGTSSFPVVTLQASFESPLAIPAAKVRRITRALPFVRVARAGRQELRLAMPLRLDGGVTAEWMTNALRHWLAALRRCDLLLRGARGPRETRLDRLRPVGTLVH
jgi:hypothetical protein